jgi:hypothetical protein
MSALTRVRNVEGWLSRPAIPAPRPALQRGSVDRSHAPNILFPRPSLQEVPMTRLIAATLLVLITATGGVFAAATPAEATCAGDYYVCQNAHVHTAPTLLDALLQSMRCTADYYRCLARQV